MACPSSWKLYKKEWKNIFQKIIKLLIKYRKIEQLLFCLSVWRDFTKFYLEMYTKIENYCLKHNS